jgi:Xaa-Pro aminopeptidase
MKSEHVVNNRKKFKELMDVNSIALIHSNTLYTSSADMNFPFEVDRDFYYLTGIEKPDFIYMVEKNADIISETLFVYRKDTAQEKWTGYRLSEKELSELSGIKNIISIDKFLNVFASVMAKTFYKTIYINTQIISAWKSYSTPHEQLAESILKKYPYIHIKNASEITVPLRLVKEDYEIEMIQKAISVTNKGILRVMKSARPDMNEIELKANFEYEIVKAGMKNSFLPIIAGGQNGLTLHYEESNEVIEQDSLILLDVGASYKNYCADVTRTFPIGGKFTEMQRKVYDIVLEANEEVIKYIKDGVTFREIEALAKAILTKGLYDIGVLKQAKDINKYYYHTIGHSLGLDAHDPCDRLIPFKAGMVITVEPGLYIKELNVAVRIEDDVLITDAGCIVLTQNIIKTADDIEKFMQNGKKA